jgi:multidrug transporter EmrE-like cation transporter
VAAATFCLAPPASFFALKELSLGTVYISTAITPVLVVVAAMCFFGEKYSRLQWAGLSLIMAGVVALNLKTIS